MKTRRSLLFGLGIFVTVSLATPTFATENEPMKNQEAVVQSLDEDNGDEGTSEVSEQGFSWEKDENGKWLLKNAGKQVTEENEGRYIYKIGTDYFCVDQDGKMVTGFVTIVSDTSDASNDLKEDGKVEKPLPGTYYFSEESSEDAEPGTDVFGKMLKDCWILETADQSKWHWLTESGVSADLSEIEKDGWQEIDGKWYELDKDGNISVDKTGWQNVNTETKTWYCLKEDGSVDTSQNGLQTASDALYLNAKNGMGTLAADWYEISTGKWYFFKDGKRDTGKIGLQIINDKTYNLSSDGTVLTGFQKVENQTYYFSKDGVRQNYTGWKTIEGKLYYFNTKYQVATQNVNGWVQVDKSWYWFENGKMVTGWKLINGTWYYMDTQTGIMKTGFYTVGGQKYYSDNSGAMLGGGWHKLGNTWYYMQGSGAVQTGWLLDRGTWYWLGSDGVMQTGWYNVGGRKYYSDGSGAMKTGWLLYCGQWYYLQPSGEMATGWIIPDKKTWYYLNPKTGVMQTGWYQVGGTWYYSYGSGAMATGWVNLGGTWYYLNGSGAMQTGWYQVGGTWYYSNSSGAMLTGWQLINKTWYYLNSSGAMAANRWIDGFYYVNGSGAMVTSAWIGNYYVGADGRWIPNYNPVTYGGKWVQQGGKWYYQTGDGSKLTNRWQKLDGKWYWFDSDGVMATGWKYIEGLKYYFNNSGALVQDLDSIIGKQSSYYITVNRVKCQVTVYAKDGANGYVIPVKTFTCSVGLPGADTATPTGTFHTLAKYSVKELMGPSWGKWATRIVGGVLFHSVACSNPDPTYSLPAGEYNKLGSPASHGCVRLNVRDAKWIYDNCALGTTVRIGDNEIKTPFDKAATIKIPASQNYDPTDPAVKR